MNDFETVRQRIQGQNGVLAASALAALDRIEAEVERLREELDHARRQWALEHDEDLVEVERLQRLVAAYEDIELIKEVERLRTALERIADTEEFDADWRAMRQLARETLVVEGA